MKKTWILLVVFFLQILTVSAQQAIKLDEQTNLQIATLIKYIKVADVNRATDLVASICHKNLLDGTGKKFNSEAKQVFEKVHQRRETIAIPFTVIEAKESVGKNGKETTYKIDFGKGNLSELKLFLPTGSTVPLVSDFSKL
ncbi:MAG: hypothetical protein NZ108_04050 [Bacteroidia bacterium]|nr:hypothetical protein [Bacteroidia bacterium]